MSAPTTSLPGAGPLPLSASRVRRHSSILQPYRARCVASARGAPALLQASRLDSHTQTLPRHRVGGASVQSSRAATRRGATPRRVVSAAAAVELPTLDDVLDSVALAYYSLLGLAAWKKTLLLALLVGAALVYYFLREKVEKFVLALQYAYDELKQSDPELKPWWQGWTMDWKDAYTEVWVPAMRRRAQRKQQRREAIERQRAAWALREQAEKELQKRIESGTFIGADEVAQRRGSQPPPPQAA